MLGNGIIFPIQLDKKGDLGVGTGRDLMVTNLTLLFGIEKGECQWDGDLGMELKKLKHMKMVELAGKAIILRQAQDQVRKYATDYVVTNAKPEIDGNESKVSIEVGERANMAKRLQAEVKI